MKTRSVSMSEILANPARSFWAKDYIGPDPVELTLHLGGCSVVFRWEAGGPLEIQGLPPTLTEAETRKLSSVLARYRSTIPRWLRS